jgi:hypothetical protein
MSDLQFHLSSGFLRPSLKNVKRSTRRKTFALVMGAATITQGWILWWSATTPLAIFGAGLLLAAATAAFVITFRIR